MIRIHLATPRQRATRESGVSTVEVVLLAPVIVLVLLLMVGAGLLVNARGVLDSASADAARMGSLQRDPGSAQKFASDVADDDLNGLVYCVDSDDGEPQVSSTGFGPGGLLVVTVTCSVSYLGMTSVSMTSVSVAPVDTYRQAG